MEKRNEVRADVTLCDRCSSKAAVIYKAGAALCPSCARLKKEAGVASADAQPLKSVADELSNQYK
jgi:hypothetical protein